MSRILLVEDHAPDVLVIRRALRSIIPPMHLDVVEDGDQVLPYLRGEGTYQSRIFPNLILLDLNLPRVSGYAVLREVKALPEYKALPIVVLSGSEATQDVYYSYSSGCSAYLVKPGSPETAEQLLDAVRKIWFGLGRTPNEP